MDEFARFGAGLGRLEDSALLRGLQKLQSIVIPIGLIFAAIGIVGVAAPFPMVGLILLVISFLFWGLAIAVGLVIFVARGQRVTNA